MKKTFPIIILVIAFLAGFFIFYRGKPASAPVVQEKNSSTSSSTQQNWPPQTDEQTAVTVIVTPIDLGVDSKEWKFDVAMNTHSVELNQDMAEVSVLVDDFGKKYPAIKWGGAEPGGHHREGVLTFEAINPMPSHLELRIKNIGGVERSFKWDLEK